MYGVCSGSGKYSDGTSKNELWKSVTKKLDKVISKMEKNYKNLAKMVIGVLQEEIGQEAYYMGDADDLEENGVMRYLIKKRYRCDALETLPEGIEYKTRQALKEQQI